MSALRELYQEIILEHNKSPRNYRVMTDATRKVEGFNPLCGDHFTVFVKLNDGIIEDVSFQGTGCAISKASASVMSTIVKGRSRKEAELLFEKFHKLVRGELSGSGESAGLGSLAAFSGVSEFPARVKCASLAWHTLHAALDAEVEVVSTE